MHALSVSTEGPAAGPCRLAYPPVPLLRGKLLPGKRGPLGLGEERVGILLMRFLDLVLGRAGRPEHSGLG